MSAIPSNPIASVLQSPVAQQPLTAANDAESNRRAAASREIASRDQQQTSEVENTDGDNTVNTDAGGQGSRGRFFEEEAPSDPAETAKSPSPHGGLDITA